MRKIKIIFVSIIMLLSGVFLTACTSREDDNVTINGMELSAESVDMFLNEYKTFSVNLKPKNVSGKEFEIVNNVDENGDDIFSVDYDFANMRFTLFAPSKFPNNNEESYTATLGVMLVDVPDVEASLVVNLKKKGQVLSSPNVICDNNVFEGVDGDGLSILYTRLTWNSVEDCQNGYVVNINGIDQSAIFTNKYDFNLTKYSGQNVSIKVKAVGASSDLDSPYSSTINFNVLSKPEIKSFYSDGSDYVLVWTEVAGATNGYNVFIDGVPYTYDNDSLISNGDGYISCRLSSNLEESKEYEIMVNANGADDFSSISSPYSNKITITRLESPKGVTISNGVLVWNTVIGAQNYRVKVVNLANEEVIINTVVNTTQYDLPTQQLDSGEYNVLVFSQSDLNTTLDSNFPQNYSFMKLDAPQNLRVENGKVVWDKDLQASSYCVYVNGTYSQTSGISSNELSMDNYNSGKYYINVSSNGNGSNVISSNKVEVDLVVTKLPITSIHFSIIDGKYCASWQNVKNSNGYIVYINNAPFEASTNCFEIPSGLSTGTNCLISVVAVGKDNFVNSNHSESKQISKLTVPAGYSTNGSIIRWKNVEGSQGYKIEVYDNTNSVVNTINNQSLNYYDTNSMECSGALSIHVQAIGDFVNSGTMNSDFSSFDFEKVETPVLSVSSGALDDSTVAGARNDYYYKLLGESEYTKLGQSYDLNLVPENTLFYLKAQAIPTEGNKVSSNFSNELMLKVLPKVGKPEIKGLTISYAPNYATFDNSGYEFLITLDDEQEASCGTRRSYAVGDLSIGVHSFSVRAKSIQGDGIKEFTSNDGTSVAIWLNSKGSDILTFTKLDCPQNLHVTSPVVGDESTVNALTNSFSNFSLGTSGALEWDAVENATSYELSFTNTDTNAITNKIVNGTLTSLQGIIDAGNYKVKISSLGNNANFISSTYSEEISFTKLVAPTNVRVENGKIEWDSTYNDSLKILFGAPAWLSDKNQNGILFVLAINDKYYVTLDLDALYNDINSITKLLQQKYCDFPSGAISSSCTIRVFCNPFNAYVSDFNSLKVKKTNNLYIMSDLSNPINVTTLDSPLGLKMSRTGDEITGDEVVSWTKMLYSNDEVSAYNLRIVKMDNEGNKTTYEHEFTKEYIDTNSTRWIFNQTDFSSDFGGEYGPGIYSFEIKAKATDGKYMTATNGVKYYYVDSLYSSAIEVIVLSSPEISVENGALTWKAVDNVKEYCLDVKNVGLVKIDAEQTSFEFGEEYAPNVDKYTFSMCAIGDGTNTISSGISSELSAKKMQMVSELKINNGIVQFSNKNTLDENSQIQYKIELTKDGKSSEFICKETAYELIQTQEAGIYQIRVKIIGDSTYLSSDYSNVIVGEKLDSVSGLSVKDGVLVWNPVSNASRYRLYISGGKIDVSGEEGEKSEEIIVKGCRYDFQVINGSEIAAGEYSVKIKALGDNSKYLNSSIIDSEQPVEKLCSINTLSITNEGILKWETDNLQVVSSEKDDFHIVILSKDGASDSVHISVGVNKEYDFNGYLPGEYSFYIYNNGDGNSIVGKSSNTYKVNKLAAPTNIGIIDDNGEKYLQFDVITGAQKYICKFVAGNVETKKEISIKGDSQSVIKVSLKDIMSDLDHTLGNNTVSTSDTSYSISIMACAGEINDLSTLDSNNVSYISSDFSAEVVYGKLGKTSLSEVLTDNGSFSGKLEWDSVDNADYYKLYFLPKPSDGNQNISDESHINNVCLYINQENRRTDAITYIGPEAVDNSTYYVYKISSDFNYCFTSYLGAFDIKVKACSNMTDTDNNLLDGDFASLYSVEYNLFEEGRGTELAPYLVRNNEQFGFIKYNMNAFYKLDSDLDGCTLDNSIGYNVNGEINQFNGYLDGNGKELKNLNMKNSNNIALFDTIGQLGEIYDLIISGSIELDYSTGKCNLGSFAINNYGKIEKCKSMMVINTTYTKNVDSAMIYAGGICVTNHGIISQSGFVGSCYGTIIGGICSINDTEGQISECYYNNLNKDEGLLAYAISSSDYSSPTYVGGICSKNSGEISFSYSNGIIRVMNALQNSLSYAGGISGYCESSSVVQNCYSIGINENNEALISSPNNSSACYVGVLVGDEVSGSKFSNNIVVYNSQSQKMVGSGKTILGTNSASGYNFASNLNTNGKNLFKQENDNYPTLVNAKY